MLRQWIKEVIAGTEMNTTKRRSTGCWLSNLRWLGQDPHNPLPLPAPAIVGLVEENPVACVALHHREWALTVSDDTQRLVRRSQVCCCYSDTCKVSKMCASAVPASLTTEHPTRTAPYKGCCRFPSSNVKMTLSYVPNFIISLFPYSIG